MPTHPSLRKVFPIVASRSAMVALLNRHRSAPGGEHPINDTVYAGDWFEIGEPDYEHMLDVVSPMFFRPGVFAVSEFKGGRVASVLVILSVAGRHRWFLGFCDLEIPQGPEMLRDAILVRETGERPHRLSRGEKLEIIWNATPSDLKGYAGASDTRFWPPEHRGKRTILVKSGAEPA